MKVLLKRNLLLFALSSSFALPWAASQTVESALTITAASAPAAVPPLVPYSGAALDAQGRTLPSPASITFLVFKEQTSGEPLFAETQTLVLDPTGHYKANLGATLPNGLPADLFSTGEARWLEVQIAGQSPQPRVLIASVPYALKAADATTLGGLPVSAFALAGQTLKAAAAPAGVTPDTASNVTTTGGTSGYIPKFSGTNTIIDSPIFVLGSDVGIGTATPTATLDVDGTALFAGLLTAKGGATVAGPLTLPATGTATASKGYNSQSTEFYTSARNSSVGVLVSPRFEWEAEVTGNNTASPGATLNLLSSATVNPLAETGFYFNPNGTLHFAPGQTFPGTGTGTITEVKAGTALTGGGTTGTVTLNVDTTKVPLLAAANSFTGNQSVTGNVSATGTVSANGDINLPATTGPGVGVVNIGGIPFLHGYSAGKNNTFVGGGGNFATTGSQNTATGYNAMKSVTSGTYNTGIGYGALFSDKIGTANVALGEQALYFTTGSANTGIGGIALYKNTSGSNNTGVGGVALYRNTSGSNNTGIGYDAGPDSGSGGLTNATAIGYSSTVSHSNSLVLGQTTAGSPGSTFVNVGIGTATPSSALETSVSVSSALGPALTLTNPGGVKTGTGTNSGSAESIDFNSYVPSSATGSIPEARIEAVDNGFYSDNLIFYNKYWDGQFSFLQQDLTIQSNGQVAVGLPTSGTLPSLTAQFTVFDTGPTGWDGIDTTGGAEVGSGIFATGGDETASSSIQGGAGGNFVGGYSPGTTGDGIDATPGDATFSSGAGWAGHFSGDVDVTGTLFAGTKDFKIDHPLDPANKYLYHASVESSEMMNIYTGNVVTDELGMATVKLPDWFEAENADFRYQLTVIGRKAQAWIAQEVGNGQFKIASDATNTKISWQITAVRQDAFAKAHPLVVEQAKPAPERGFYQNPELFGQPAERQTEWGRHPQQMQRMKEMRERQKLAARQPSTHSHDQPASAVNRVWPAPPLPQ